MQYVSTRDKANACTASQAILRGLASDGGLYVPDSLPCLTQSVLDSLQDMSYPERAAFIMSLFLEDFTEEELTAYTTAAYGPDRFDTPAVAPLHPMQDDVWCLELWHGPTCAFKDLALQMLPHLLAASIRKQNEDHTVCILVATSGDTGKAALEGFRDVAGTKILVFYPRDGVSEVQKLQMITQAGGNVNVCAVNGNFDDAQNGVKRIFSDAAFGESLAAKGLRLSSANSINWGRVLPQLVYYISAWCDMRKRGELKLNPAVNICVPTGNFGNILAALYAKLIGLPVNKLICASNSNNVLTDFLRTGIYDRNRPFHMTMSPSMDILISSNLERLLFLLSRENDALVRRCMKELTETGRYEISPAMKEHVSELFWGGFCDEEHTAAAIRDVWEKQNYLIDTHTAVAVDVLGQYRRETDDHTPCILASTASPFKFSDSVLRSLGEENPPAGLDAIDELGRRTGVQGPAPLCSLRGREVRFTGCVEPDGMYAPVADMA